MSGTFRARSVQLSELVLADSGYRPGGYSAQICRADGVRGQSLGLYKGYSDKALAQLNTGSLDKLVCWRQDLAHEDRRFLDSFCAFPHTIVLDGSHVTGILMNEAPDAFLHTIPGEDGLRPRHAEALGRRYRKDLKEGLDYYPPPHKASILGVLLKRMIWLHDHDVIISDLHSRNTLVTADIGMREIYLLDCDSFWLGDSHALPPHAPEMWRVGDGNSSTQATDRAKFAMLTSRAVGEYFGDRDFSETPLLRLLPSHHVRQLRRMFSIDESLRTEKLLDMANSWTGLVRSSHGQPTLMYAWTDKAGHVLWSGDSKPG